MEPRTRGRPPLFDWPAVLKEAYRQGDAPSEVAAQLGVNLQTVSAATRRHGIKLRDGRDKRWDGIRRLSDRLRKWLKGQRN